MSAPRAGLVLGDLGRAIQKRADAARHRRRRVVVRGAFVVLVDELKLARDHARRGRGSSSRGRGRRAWRCPARRANVKSTSELTEKYCERLVVNLHAIEQTPVDGDKVASMAWGA